MHMETLKKKISMFPLQIRFISDFSFAYKKKHKNSDIDFIISRCEKKALLLASNFITRIYACALDELLLFVIANRARNAHVSACSPAITRTRVWGWVVSRGTSPMTCSSAAVKRYHCEVVGSLRRQAIETSHSHRPWSPFVSSLFPPSLSLFLTHSLTHSLVLQLLFSLFLEAWIYLAHPILRSHDRSVVVLSC